MGVSHGCRKVSIVDGIVMVKMLIQEHDGRAAGVVMLVEWSVLHWNNARSDN